MATISEIKEKIYEKDRQLTAFIAIYDFKSAAVAAKQMAELAVQAADMSAAWKYAGKRREVLREHAPGMYKAMAENGSLEEHLISVQDSAEKYIENYIARFTHSDEYLKAEKKDPAEAMRLLNMTALEAEDAAYRIWIANIPEDDETDDETEED